jgi:hypothetical protein
MKFGLLIPLKIILMMMNHSTAGCFMTHVKMTSQMMSFESE